LELLRRQGGISVTADTSRSRIPVDGELANEGPPITTLLVCVKAHQTLSAINGLGHRLAAGSRVIFMQNGMGQLSEIAAHYPDIEIYPAVTTEGAWRRAPFCIVHAGRGETWFGPYRCDDFEHQPTDLIRSFRASGLTTHWDPDIALRQWHKLAVNCVVNPLTALLRCPNGGLLKAEAKAPLSELCLEVERVTKARGVTLSAPLRDLVEEVLRATAKNRSSMLQDFEAGRETEIDYISGFMVREAEALGIPVPTNRLCIDLVRLSQAIHSGNDRPLPP
jgi:2-dehydropantoate 2-reductase